MDAANEKNRSRRAALVVGLVALFSFARKCWSARRVMLCFALALGACCAAFKQKVGKFLEEFIGMPSYLFPALGWVIPPSMDISGTEAEPVVGRSHWTREASGEASLAPHR